MVMEELINTSKLVRLYMEALWKFREYFSERWEEASNGIFYFFWVEKLKMVCDL